MPKREQKEEGNDEDRSSKTKRISERQEKSVPLTKADTDDVFKLPLIYNQIFSFLSSESLCTLDLVNKEFRTVLTASAWNDISSERFGSSFFQKTTSSSSSSSSSSSVSGKERWRRGISFLRSPSPVPFKLHDSGDFGFGCSYPPGAAMTTNQSIMVGVTDETTCPADRTFPAPQNPMGIRQAYSLNYSQTMPSPIRGNKVTICGRVGSETIFTTNQSHVAACRGNTSQTFSIHDLDDVKRNRSNVDVGYSVIPCIGSETHLVLVALHTVHVFEVVGVDLTRDEEDDHDDPSLLRHKQSIPLPPCSESSRVITDYCRAVDWSPDKSHFAVCYPHVIYVYKFEVSSGSRGRDNDAGGEGRTIAVVFIEEIPILQDEAGDDDDDDEDYQADNVELAENYLVVSLKGKKLRVYDWHTSCWLHNELCDVKEWEQLDDDDDMDGGAYYPISMVSVGDLLLSSSHIGACYLCIWNMKTGTLLKSHKNDFKASVHNDGGIDANGLVYLHHLNAVVMMAYSMIVYGFPFDDESKRMLTSIRRRERNMQRGQYGMRHGEMRGTIVKTVMSEDSDE